jgi:hypothetical protein
MGVMAVMGLILACGKMTRIHHRPSGNRLIPIGMKFVGRLVMAPVSGLRTSDQRCCGGRQAAAPWFMTA